MICAEKWKLENAKIEIALNLIKDLVSKSDGKIIGKQNDKFNAFVIAYTADKRFMAIDAENNSAYTVAVSLAANDKEFEIDVRYDKYFESLLTIHDKCVSVREFVNAYNDENIYPSIMYYII